MNIKNIKLSKLKKIATILGVIGAIQIATVTTKPQNIYNIAKATQPNPGDEQNLQSKETISEVLGSIAQMFNSQNLGLAEGKATFDALREKIITEYRRLEQESGKAAAEKFLKDVKKKLSDYSVQFKRQLKGIEEKASFSNLDNLVSKFEKRIKKEVSSVGGTPEEKKELETQSFAGFLKFLKLCEEGLNKADIRNDEGKRQFLAFADRLLKLNGLGDAYFVVKDVPLLYAFKKSPENAGSFNNTGKCYQITVGELLDKVCSRKNMAFLYAYSRAKGKSAADTKNFLADRNEVNNVLKSEDYVKESQILEQSVRQYIIYEVMRQVAYRAALSPTNDDIRARENLSKVVIGDKYYPLKMGVSAAYKYYKDYENNPEMDLNALKEDGGALFLPQRGARGETFSFDLAANSVNAAAYHTVDKNLNNILNLNAFRVFLSNLIGMGIIETQFGELVKDTDDALGTNGGGTLWGKNNFGQILTGLENEFIKTGDNNNTFYVYFDYRVASQFAAMNVITNATSGGVDYKGPGGSPLKAFGSFKVHGAGVGDTQKLFYYVPQVDPRTKTLNFSMMTPKIEQNTTPGQEVTKFLQDTKMRFTTLCPELATALVDMFGEPTISKAEFEQKKYTNIRFKDAAPYIEVVSKVLGQQQAAQFAGVLVELSALIAKDVDTGVYGFMVDENTIKKPENFLQLYINYIRARVSFVSDIVKKVKLKPLVKEYLTNWASNLDNLNVVIPALKVKKNLDGIETSKSEDLVDLTGVVSYDNNLIDSKNLVEGLKFILQEVSMTFSSTMNSYFGNAQTIDRLKLEIILGYFYNMAQVWFSGNFRAAYPKIYTEIYKQVVMDNQNRATNIKDEDVYDFFDKMLNSVLAPEKSSWSNSKIKQDAQNEYAQTRELLARIFKNKGKVTREQLLTQLRVLYMLDDEYAAKIAKKESMSESDLITVGTIIARNTQDSVENFWKNKIKKFDYYGKTEENKYYGVLLHQCKAIQTALTNKGVQLFREYYNEKASSNVKKQLKKISVDFTETDLQQLNSMEDEISYVNKATEKYKALKEEKPSGGYFSSSDSWGGVVSENSQGVKSGLAENIASEYKQDFDIMYNVSRRLQEGLEELRKIRNESLLDSTKTTSRAFEDKMESVRKEYAEGLIKVIKNQIKRVEEEAGLYKKMIARMASSQAREKLLEGIKEYVQKNLKDSSTSNIQEMLKTIYKALNKESGFLDDYDDYFRSKKDKIKFNKNDTPMRKIVKAIALEVNTEGGIKKRLLRTTVLQIIAKEMCYEFFRQNTAREIYTIASYDFTSFKNNEKIKKLSELLLSKEKDKTPSEQLKEILETMLKQLDSSKYYGETKLDLKIAFKSGENVKESLQKAITKAYRKLEKALQSGEEKDQKDEEEEQKQKDEAEEAQAKKEEEEAKKAEEEEAKKAAEEEAKKAKAVDVETIRTAVVENAKQKTQDATVATLLEDSAAVSQARIVYRQEKGKKKVKIENVIKTPGTNLRIYWILDNQNPAIIDIPEGAESSETEIPFPSSTIEQAIHVYRRNQATGAEEFIGSTVINNAKDLQGTEIGAAKAVAIAGETGENKPIEDYMEGAAFDLRDCYYVHITNSKDRQLLNYIAVALSAKDEPIKDGRLPIVKYLDGSYGITINKRILRNCGGDFTIHLYNRTMGEASAFDSQIVIKLEPDGANKNVNPADAAQNAAQNAAQEAQNAAQEAQDAAQEAQDAAGGAETTGKNKKEAVKKEELEEEDEDAAGGKKEKEEKEEKGKKTKKKKRDDDDEDEDDDDEDEDEDDDEFED